MTGNRQVWLAARPDSIPQPEHFAIRDAEVPAIGDGEFLVRNIYLSADPAARGWIVDTGNYVPRVEIGETVRAFALGEVVESRHADFPTGTFLVGTFGWQEYAAATPAQVSFRVTRGELPLSLSLGVLGINGLTAYFGLLRIGEPRPGDTVVVSSGAGAVGSCVGQIARLHGCRTVAIAGGADKSRKCVEEFGFDAAVDYKDRAGFDAALDAACPDGANVYFDNVSGAVSDAVLARLALGARVAICGTASLSRWDPWPQGPRAERHLLVKRARMQGFVATDFVAEYGEAQQRLSQWVAEGAIRYGEDIRDDLDYAPFALRDLYAGANDGKLIMRLPAAADYEVRL